MSKSIKKFVYVSVFNAHMLGHLEIVKAHEDFAGALRHSGLDYAVIHPTGFFSDMSEFLKMARSGKVYLIGNGENRINPIHGADLVAVCVDAVASKEREIPVGGPVSYSVNEIAELAFSTLGKSPRVTRIPPRLVGYAVKLVRPFSRNVSDLAAFFLAAGQNDIVAPATDTHTLRSYYQELATQMLEEKHTVR